MNLCQYFKGVVGSAAVFVLLTGGFWLSGSKEISAEEVDVVDMSEMVVTASRAEEDVATVSANVTVIDADEIAASSAISTVDLLKDVAGLNVAEWTGTGRTASVDIRGFGETADANTLVVVDGRRINPPDMSGIDWTTIPLDRIQRIEIIRGGGSVLYGNNATGGVINIITQKGAEKHTANVSTTFGSFDYFNQSAGVAGSTERLTYNIHGNYMETDGYRDNSDLESKNAGLHLGYAEDFYELSLNAGIKDDSYGLPGAIPEDSKRRKDAASPDDFAESRDYYIHFTPQLYLSDNAALSWGMSARKHEAEAEYTGFLVESDLYYYEMSPQLTNRFDLAGMRHDMIVGFDFQYSNLKQPGGNDSKMRDVGLFIHDKVMPIENHYFNFGLRGTRASYNIDNRPDDSFRVYAATTGWTFNYAPASKIFVSLERGYRLALLDELGGENFDEILDPQTSMHYQAGISHQLNRMMKVGATVFHIDTKDEILFDPLMPTEFFMGQNVNYEKTRRQGFELEMTAKPHEMLRLFGNYTLMDNELRGGAYDGNDIPGVAKHSATAGATFFPISGLSLDMRARWAADKTLISDWENEVGDDWEGGDYIVADVMLSYAWKALAVNFGVNNVFDEEYSEYGLYSQDFNTGDYYNAIYPAPERNYFGELRLAYEF